MRLLLLSLLTVVTTPVLAQHDFKDRGLRTREGLRSYETLQPITAAHNQYRRSLAYRDLERRSLIQRGIGRTSRSNSLVDLNRTPSPQPQRPQINHSPSGTPSPSPEPANTHQRSPSPPAKLSPSQQKLLNDNLNRWSQSPSPGASPRNDAGYHWTMFGWKKNGEQEGMEMKSMGSRTTGGPQEVALSSQMQKLTIPKRH